MPTTDSWTDLCAAADVKPGVGLYLEHDNRRLTVWRIGGGGAGGERSDGGVSRNDVSRGDVSCEGISRDDDAHDDGPATFRVMDDACPHAGGSLSAGVIDDGCVICPWHGWAFNADSGACPDNEAYRVRVYAVRVHNGRVLARL